MPRKKKVETDLPRSRSVEKTKRAPKAKAAKAPPPANVFKPAKPSKALKSAGAPKTVPPPSAKGSEPRESDSSTWKKPPRQGETRMVAFVRDPYCLFTYWEVTPQSVEAVKKQLADEYRGSSRVLRLFKVGADGREELVDEIKVEAGEMNRYIELKETGGSYFIEIAQKTVGGRAVAYARSNRIVTSAPQASGRAESDPSWEPPAGLTEYFSETADPETLFIPKGISSAESQQRKRNRYSSSHVG